MLKNHLIRQIGKAVAWATILPFVGFLVMTVMLFGIPLLFLFAAPGRMIEVTLIAGFAPSLVVTLLIVFAREQLNGWLLVPIAALVSSGAAWVWWSFVLTDSTSGNTTMMIIAAVASLAMSLPSAFRHRSGDQASALS